MGLFGKKSVPVSDIETGTTNEVEKAQNYLTYSDNEMKELAELIELYFASLKQHFAPGLNHFMPQTVQNHAKKFLLERRAFYNLNQESIARGFQSAAHEQAMIAREQAEKQAAEKAKEEAIQRAKEEAEAKAMEEQLIREKELREEREKQDAENQAKEKADREAKILAAAMEAGEKY